mgnify:FL=1|tara:strand:- start:139 stop:477 length:339 start_codon:yes stop_codon:yes gene_type:complete
MAYTDVEDEQRSKLPKWLCAEDAEKRNKQNIESYSQEQVYKAETFRDMVVRAYFRSRIYLNFRERFIAIKVEAPNIRDKISKEAREVIEFADENDIKIIKRRASLIFRLYQT